MIKNFGRFIKTHNIWKSHNQFQRPENLIKSQVKSHFKRILLIINLKLCTTLKLYFGNTAIKLHHILHLRFLQFSFAHDQICPPPTGNIRSFIHIYATFDSQFLPSATKLQRLWFYRCLSVHRGGAWSRGVPAPRRGLFSGGSGPGGCLVLGGWYPSMHWGRPPWERRLLLRMVRILLECIIVLYFFLPNAGGFYQELVMVTWLFCR